VLAAERGYTIIEMVITCALTLIVSVSAMAVLTRAYAHNNDIQRRSESMQIARTAVDDMVRRLRSEVCLDSATPPISAATGRSVTYYAAFNDGSPSTYPERHVLSLNATTGVLSDARYTTTTGNATDYTLADTRVIAKGVSESGATPLMQFYGYDSSTPPAATRLLNTGTNAVSDDDLEDISRVVITLVATAPGNTASKLASTVQDEVFVRLTDPSDPNPNPDCT
jgi:type II secretory pathway pseudopilin PulG